MRWFFYNSIFNQVFVSTSLKSIVFFKKFLISWCGTMYSMRCLEQFLYKIYILILQPFRFWRKREHGAMRHCFFYMNDKINESLEIIPIKIRFWRKFYKIQSLEPVDRNLFIGEDLKILFLFQQLTFFLKKNQ